MGQAEHSLNRWHPTVNPVPSPPCRGSIPGKSHNWPGRGDGNGGELELGPTGPNAARPAAAAGLQPMLTALMAAPADTPPVPAPRLSAPRCCTLHGLQSGAVIDRSAVEASRRPFRTGATPGTAASQPGLPSLNLKAPACQHALQRPAPSWQPLGARDWLSML